MYKQIKALADEAIALQNKDRMDAALREISGICQAAADELANAYGALAVKRGRHDLLERAPAAGDATPADVLAAAQPGDAVQVTGTSDGAGNEKVLDVKVVPARHTGLDSPIVTAILADAPTAKPGKKGAK